MCKEKFEFQDGDIASFGGVEGVVRIDNDRNYPVLWQSRNEKEQRAFTLDGKLYHYHTEPVLKLVHRQKKKVKKTIEGWVNVYREGSEGLFKSSEQANAHVHSERIACVHVTGEYEIEE